MCTALFAYKAHPEFDWIFLGNRDEFHKRPSIGAHFWMAHPNLLAGKDLEKGGTWMGIAKSGRFALLTNYRKPSLQVEPTQSRGYLTLDYLLEQDPQITARKYAQSVLEKKEVYDPFNLVVGDVNGLYYVNNVDKQMIQIEPGVHGLSNASLNTPWPKVEKGKARLQQLLGQFFTVSDLFEILDDAEQSPDDNLPQTGVSLEVERLLSTVHIESEHYGTQYKTIMLIDKNRLVRMYEKHKNEKGSWVIHDFSFYVGI